MDGSNLYLAYRGAPTLMLDAFGLTATPAPGTACPALLLDDGQFTCGTAVLLQGGPPRFWTQCQDRCDQIVKKMTGWKYIRRKLVLETCQACCVSSADTFMKANACLATACAAAGITIGCPFLP